MMPLSEVAPCYNYTSLGIFLFTVAISLWIGGLVSMLRQHYFG